MQKHIEKRKHTQYHNYGLRLIHYLPLLLGYMFLCISSWFGSIVITHLAQFLFIYPLMYFLHNTIFHLILAFIFAGIWLFLLIRKARAFHVFIGMASILFSIFVYVFLFLIIGEMHNIDSISTTNYNYYITQMSRQSLLATDGPLNRTVLKCDSLSIMCDVKLSQHIGFAEYYVDELEVKAGQLLVIHSPTRWASDKEVRVTVIEDKFKS